MCKNMHFILLLSETRIFDTNDLLLFEEFSFQFFLGWPAQRKTWSFWPLVVFSLKKEWDRFYFKFGFYIKFLVELEFFLGNFEFFLENLKRWKNLRKIGKFVEFSFKFCSGYFWSHFWEFSCNKSWKTLELLILFLWMKIFGKISVKFSLVTPCIKQSGVDFPDCHQNFSHNRSN